MKDINVKWNKDKQVFDIEMTVDIKQDNDGNYYIEDTYDFETSITIDDIRGGKGNSILNDDIRRNLISNTIIYFDLCEKYTKEVIDRVLSDTDIELKDIETHIHKVGDEWCFLDFESLEEYSMGIMYNSNNDNISQLKSKIKYSKNHLERIKLEKELSELYKKRKYKK